MRIIIFTGLFGGLNETRHIKYIVEDRHNKSYELLKWEKYVCGCLSVWTMEHLKIKISRVYHYMFWFNMSRDKWE